MSYCPEHGNLMSCRNPTAYDTLVYDCPEGHVMVYEMGSYTAYEVSAHCMCGHLEIDHVLEVDYAPCTIGGCDCGGFTRESGSSKVGQDSPAPTQAYTGMQDVMVVQGGQLVAKEYAHGTLTDEDIIELADLGKRLILSLECDLNGGGVPCRTDRLAAVGLMRRYLEIHDT